MVDTVYLENARAIVQGTGVLIFLSIAYFIHFEIGMILVAVQGLLIVQSGFTDRCVPDPFLRRMGLKKKLE